MWFYLLIYCSKGFGYFRFYDNLQLALHIFELSHCYFRTVAPTGKHSGRYYIVPNNIHGYIYNEFNDWGFAYFIFFEWSSDYQPKREPLTVSSELKFTKSALHVHALCTSSELPVHFALNYMCTTDFWASSAILNTQVWLHVWFSVIILKINCLDACKWQKYHCNIDKYKMSLNFKGILKISMIVEKYIVIV